jgi:hypothetical protein
MKKLWKIIGEDVCKKFSTVYNEEFYEVPI